MGYNASMITAAEARKIADDYVSANRNYCVVTGLLEDDSQFFVATELKPKQEWPLGPGAMFISKDTGELREEPWGVAIPIKLEMEPVAS